MNLKKMNLLFVIAIVLILFSLIFNFAFAEKKLLIAFSQSSMNHPWRVTLTNDMKYWAEKMEVDFIWTDGNNEAANQLADCEDLIAKKPDALVLSPLQAKALTPVVDMCNKAGVPLIVVDRYLDVDPGTGMYIAFIGLDQTKEGRACTEILVEKLYEKFGDYKGNIVEIQGTIGASAAIDMNIGFRQVVDKYPGIKVIASLSGDYLRENALKIMEDWLETFPKGQIDAVFAHNDEMGLGALTAIKSAGRDELIGCIGSVDGQVQALKAIVEGDYLVSVQEPPYFGEAAIKTALNYLNKIPITVNMVVQFKVFHAQTAEARKIVEEYHNYMIANDLMY